jgi:hypothetical protein
VHTGHAVRSPEKPNAGLVLIPMKQQYMQQLLPAAVCFWQAAYIDMVLTVEQGTFGVCHTGSGHQMVWCI